MLFYDLMFNPHYTLKNLLQLECTAKYTVSLHFWT